MASGPLSIWKTDDGFLLRVGDSTLNLDLDRAQGTGYLTSAFWQEPLSARRDFFLLGLVMLSRRHQRFALHANGVVNGDCGYLVVGDSGRGKSTLTVALVCAGWRYLGDDVIVLREQASALEALALRRGMSLTRKTMASFPQVKKAAIETFDLDPCKDLVMLDQMASERLVLRCRPAVLLFPEIGDARVTRATPIDGTAVLTTLIHASAGIMVDAAWSQKQLAVLHRLTAQCRAYRLQLGRDVYQEPQKVADLLAGLDGV